MNRKIIVYDYYKASKKRKIEKQNVPETKGSPKAEKPEPTFSRNPLLQKVERGPVTHLSKNDSQHLTKPEKHDSFELLLKSLISSEELTRSYEDVLQETNFEIPAPQPTDSPREENVEATSTTTCIPPADDLLTEDVFAKLLSPNPSSNKIIIQRAATQNFSVSSGPGKRSTVSSKNVSTEQQNILLVKQTSDSFYDFSQEVRQLEINSHAKLVGIASSKASFSNEDKEVDSVRTNDSSHQNGVGKSTGKQTDSSSCRERVSSDDLFGILDPDPCEITYHTTTRVKAVPETELIDILASQDKTCEDVAQQTRQNYVESSLKFDDSLDKLLLEDLLTSSSKSSENYRNPKRNEVLDLANTKPKLPGNSESVSEDSESYLLNFLTGSFGTSDNERKLENLCENSQTQCSFVDNQAGQNVDVVDNISVAQPSQKRTPISENSDSFKLSLKYPSLRSSSTRKHSEKHEKVTTQNKTTTDISKIHKQSGNKQLDQKFGRGSLEQCNSVGKSLSSFASNSSDRNPQKNFGQHKAHRCLIENKSEQNFDVDKKLNKPESMNIMGSTPKNRDHISNRIENFRNDHDVTSAKVTEIDILNSKSRTTQYIQQLDRNGPEQGTQLDKKKIQCLSSRKNPQQFVPKQPKNVVSASNNSRLTRSSARIESDKKVDGPKLSNEDMIASKSSKNSESVLDTSKLNVLKPQRSVSNPSRTDKCREVYEIDLTDKLSINNKTGGSVGDQTNTKTCPELNNLKDKSLKNASVASTILNKNDQHLERGINAQVNPLKCVSADDSDSTVSDLEIPGTDVTTIKRPYDVALLLGFDQNGTETENKSEQYSALLTTMDMSNKVESNVESLSKHSELPSEHSSNLFGSDTDNSITFNTKNSAESKIDPVRRDQVSIVHSKKSDDASQSPAPNREPSGSRNQKSSRHILQCLSNKATKIVGQCHQSSVDSIGFPSENTNAGSRIAVHNINQIATESWLRTATTETNLKNKQQMITKIHPMPDTESKENLKPKVKRYTKGRTKIYRTKFARKKAVAINEDNFTVDGIIEHLTQSCSNNEKNTKCNESLSTRSVPSSYVTDETRSNASNRSTRSTLCRDLPEPERKLKLGLSRIFRDETLKCADMSLLFGTDKEQIKMKIQELFFEVFEALEEGRTPCLKVRKKTFENCVFEDDRLQMKSSIEAEMKTVSYGNSQSHFRFCLILHVMAKIYTLIENDTKLTKREMFYQIKHIIKSQDQINDAIEDISCFLNVGPWELNIISHRGLIYGSLKITYASKEVLNCNVPGVMIPYDVDDIIELMSEAYFILVVEKEAIFHKLLEEDLPNKLSRPFIMITGKGFPDLNTQLFLKKLWTLMSIPVFILVDADPHGIQIMITYRFGSLNSSHLSNHLAIPNARWLGVFPSEISKFGINSSPMIPKEGKMVQSLLETPYVKKHPRLMEELEVLLSKNRKASIEGLIKSNNFLSTLYLPTKFFSRDYI